ncbi:MAG: DNA-binding protein [Planctomycetota bacterium]|nr:DNA-binding protein [Planctomycetota bacterium]
MKVKEVKNGYLIVLERGEEVVKSLTDFAKKQHLEGGEIHGIGGVTNVTLGFFDTKKKEYIRQRFDANFELLSLVGNISLLEGNPFCHLHAVISGGNFSVFGGHLFEATISVTAEIYIRVQPKVERQPNPDIGLNLIN